MHKIFSAILFLALFVFLFDPQAAKAAEQKGKILIEGDSDQKIDLILNQPRTITFRLVLNSGKSATNVAWSFIGTLPQGINAALKPSNSDMLEVVLTGLQTGITGAPLQAQYSVSASGTLKKKPVIANIIFSVTPAPPDGSFSIEANPKTVSLNAGERAAVAIITQSVGIFSGTVVLNAEFPDKNITISFNPELIPVNSSSTLVIETTPALAAGTYSIRVNGLSGIKAQTISVELRITPPPGSDTPPTITTTPIIQNNGAWIRIPDSSPGQLISFPLISDKNFVKGRHKWFLSSKIYDPYQIIEGNFFESSGTILDPTASTTQFQARIRRHGFIQITIHIIDSSTTPPNLSAVQQTFRIVAPIPPKRDFPVNVVEKVIRNGGSVTVTWSAPNPNARTLIFVGNSEFDNPDRVNLGLTSSLALERGGTSATVPIVIYGGADPKRFVIRVIVDGLHGTSQEFEVIP